MRLYRWPRASVHDALRFIEEKPDLEVENRTRFGAAVQAFAAGAEFADELLVARAREVGCTALVTFDVSLQRRHASVAIPPGKS